MATILQSSRAQSIYRPALRILKTSINDRQRIENAISNNISFQIANSSICIAQPHRHFSYPTFVADIYREISMSKPVSCIQDGLICFHDISGLPWWAAIILSTVLLRTIVTLPLAIYQNKISARLEMISFEMQTIAEQLKGEAKYLMATQKLTEQQIRVIYNRSAKQQWNELIIRENCHPLKTVIVLWGQIPLWIFQSMALRNMVTMLPDPTSFNAQLIRSGLSVGGFGWVPNLTMADTTLILPISLAVINLAIIELQGMQKHARTPSKIRKTITWFFRGFSVLMIPIAATVPSCLAVYWVTSSAAALAQNLLLLSPRFKRLTGIPANTKSHMESPYRYMAEELVERIQSKRSFIERLLKRK